MSKINSAEPRASASGRFESVTLEPISPAQLAAGLAGASTPDCNAEFAGRARAVAGPVSAARMAANVANAQLSSGPRTELGLAKSSQNAVKSALTGRTVLLPTDDVEEYAAFLESWQNDLQPEGPIETELVQIIVDCHWRLRRIQELEYALYVHGERQFAGAFAEEPEATRRSMIMLQTHLTYQKEFRNFHIQEARIDRKRAKALKELEQLQANRQSSQDPAEPSAMDGFSSEADLFAAMDAGYVPTHVAEYFAKQKELKENGFVFSNSTEALNSESSAASVDPLIEPKAA
jgi:hypothetical protein